MKNPFCAVVTGQSLISHDVRHVEDKAFVQVLDFLRQGDVVFTNFESTILGRYGGWPTKGKYFDCTKPEMLDALQAMGFNTLALANNHAFDLGPNGVLSTLEEVAARDFLHAGIGADHRRAATPGRRQMGSRSVTLLAMDAGPGPDNMYAENGSDIRPARPGVNRLKTVRKLGVSDGHLQGLARLSSDLQSSYFELANYAQPQDLPPQGNDAEINFYGTIFTPAADHTRLIEVDAGSEGQQQSAIREAAAQGDFVIAYVHHHHWEPGWQDVPRWVQTFARRCIDAGANIFVSHGAPVLQAVEIYNGAPIFYGLGNFLFHVPPEEKEWGPPEVWQSIVAACRYDAGGSLEGIELLPVVIGGERQCMSSSAGRLVPVAAAGIVARDILEGFADRSRAFGTQLTISEGSGSVSLQANRKFG